MITKEQITQLETLLGRAIRLATSIEFGINNIYCYKKTENIPLIYQDENLNIIANDKFNKSFRKAEHDSFKTSLKELKDIDTEYKVFSKEWYKKLDDFRLDRNAIVHEFTCGYLYHHGSDEQKLKEYKSDIKRLNDFIEKAIVYENFIEERQKDLFKLDNL